MDAQLAQHVTGVVVSDRGAPVRGRTLVDPVRGWAGVKERCQFEGLGPQPLGPRRGVMIAGQFEKLRPEDFDHGGARTGGHDDGIGAVGFESVKACASHSRRVGREPGVPRRLPATRLSERAAHLASTLAQHPHRRFPHIGRKYVDHARDEEAHPAGIARRRRGLDGVHALRLPHEPLLWFQR